MLLNALMSEWRARRPSLSADETGTLAAEHEALLTDVHRGLEQSPLSPHAQRLGDRWLASMQRLYATRSLSDHVEALGLVSQEATPFAAWPGWAFLRQVLAARI